VIQIYCWNLDLFQFAIQIPQSIVDGVNDTLFSDLEDSYQAHTAVNESCDMILTINVKHFKLVMEEGVIEVLSPQDFMQRFVR